QEGHLLSSRVDLTEGYEVGQGNDAARRVEETMRRNVRDLLAPVIGDSNFRVSVSADVDNDRVKETHERYGETPKIMSEALREEQDRDPLALGRSEEHTSELQSREILVCRLLLDIQNGNINLQS